MSRRSWVSKSATVLAAGDAQVRTIGQLLEIVTGQLETSEMLEAHGEAKDIVAALLDVPRFWPAANMENEAPAALIESAIRAAGKRGTGAPLAYAVGRASFRHLTLEVDENVLIPRVETERLVEAVLERCTRSVRTIADIGTGSGAIALSLAYESDFDNVIGTDISRGALATAENNARLLASALRSPVEFLNGAVLAPLVGRRVDAIVSNPPYIAYSEGQALPYSVRDWEPAVALLSGDDGLAVTRRIIAQAPSVLTRGGILALEVDTRRAGSVAEMIAVDGRYIDIEVLPDLTGRERFVFAWRS
jgi:release factor glutamine methyltransferase